MRDTIILRSTTSFRKGRIRTIILVTRSTTISSHYIPFSLTTAAVHTYTLSGRRRRKTQYRTLYSFEQHVFAIPSIVIIGGFERTAKQTHVCRAEWLRGSSTRYKQIALEKLSARPGFPRRHRRRRERSLSFAPVYFQRMSPGISGISARV